MSTTLQTPPALLAGEGLPHFEAITPDQVSEHMPELLPQLAGNSMDWRRR